MNDEEISARALDAWPAAEPPPDFAERVLAARRPTATAPRVRYLRAAIAACVAVMAITAAWAIRDSRSSAGQKIALARETIALGDRGLAVAEAGTHLSWSVSATRSARIEQTEGNVFYRVEPGGPFVVAAPGAEVTAAGTCFRVEVIMATTMENTRAALLGAAAASLVLVTVYEGHVRVQQGGAGQGAVELSAGEQSRFAGPAAANITIAQPQAAIVSAVRPSQLVSLDSDPTVLRARIAELEGQVAKLSTAAKPAEGTPAGMFDKVRGFTPEELRDMAAKCQLRMGSPDYESTPPALDADAAQKLSVSASETEQINQILAAQNSENQRAMREIYISATGDAAGADQLDPGTMLIDLIKKTPWEQAAAARREIAAENAGLATAPANLAGESPITRLYRLQNNAGTKLDEALAAALGHAEADRVIDALTPVHLFQGGCPGESH